MFNHGDKVVHKIEKKEGLVFGQSKAIPQRDGVDVYLVQWPGGDVEHVKETDIELKPAE